MQGTLSNLCEVRSLNRSAKPLFPADVATFPYSSSSPGWLDLSRGDLSWSRSVVRLSTGWADYAPIKIRPAPLWCDAVQLARRRLDMKAQTKAAPPAR